MNSFVRFLIVMWVSLHPCAAEWGVDPAKVGVMGSSAGGHLVSMCATLWDVG